MAELTSKEPSPDCVFGTKAGSKSCKSEHADGSAGASPLNPSCPQCNSKKVWRDGNRYTIFDDKIQRWLCKECGHRFSDKDDLQKTKQAIETVNTKSLKTHTAIVTTSQICVTETKNLEAEQQTNQVPRRNEENRGKIVEPGFWMQKEGYAESTISRRIRLLGTLLNKGADLKDPESVKETIAKQKSWTTKTKQIAVETYDCFLKSQDLTWKKPIYQAVKKLPSYRPKKN